MNKINLLSLLGIILLTTTAFSTSAYAFDPTQINMTLNDVQTTSYTEFDVLTIFFSLFNNGTETSTLSGHNMLYLNDTNANYWEMSTDNHIEGMSNTCPILNSTINSGQSDDIQICYVIPKSADIGYSLVLNNDYYMMDWEIAEFTLEAVPFWFSSTASDWCTDRISDSEYFTIAQLDIQDPEFTILRTQSGEDVGTSVPSWVKTNACDWSNELISDYEFLDGIYWLIDNGKIQI
jgi:hypothetical protein